MIVLNSIGRSFPCYIKIQDPVNTGTPSPPCGIWCIDICCCSCLSRCFEHSFRFLALLHVTQSCQGTSDELLLADFYAPHEHPTSRIFYPLLETQNCLMLVGEPLANASWTIRLLWCCIIGSKAWRRRGRIDFPGPLSQERSDVLRFGSQKLRPITF
ncbi:hypothetical protein DL98DRAFT_516653 [Cadophora sp. DSE1049]|nr:hypothetical protein DL98DRAFT_516653 [Cadophora sp. DSE1049]